MDIPTTDSIGAPLLVGLSIAAVTWMGSEAFSWIGGVNDAVRVVDTHTEQISTLVDTAEETKDLAQQILNNQSRIEGEVGVIKDITLQNMELGARFRESIEE